MRIAFNPSTVAALTTPPNNKDITFDLRGQNIFARGVKFYGTDTNTWRDIKVNNVSIGSHTLDLRNGSNTTLTNTNGVVTINSTWRPVVDNLTSNSTTSSLSANQGRVLKALIDGKSDSGHNHDGRYVYNYGGTAANGQTLNQNALFMSTTSGITGDWWHILQAAWNGEYRWNSQIAFPTQNRNGMYYRSGLDDNTKWGSWVKLLDANNYSSTLDSRYYTESEVNSLLSNKLNTSNFNWTNLPGKIVAGNEFNIVNAGFKEGMWFNYLPINDRGKTATISGYHFGNGAKGYTSIVASGFIKNGGNASQLLRADGGVAAFNWSGQSGQPTWLWGGNSQHSYYVYNPSNFSVKYAASAGNADTVDGYHATDGRTFNGNINWGSWSDTWSDGTHTHPWYGFDHRYPNTGAYSTTISDYFGMTIKTANNLRLDCANLLINGIIYINNGNFQIRREGSSQAWVNGRNGALLRETSVAGYHTLWSLKTTDGSWDFGEYNAGSGWNNIPVLSYITDSNYNSRNNAPTYQIKFPLASGTVALINDVNNYYWANVKISASSSTTTSPTVHTLTATRVCAGHDPGIDNSISCSNWFRSSGNTGWYNTTYRGGWYMSDTSWIRAHNGVGIYTGGQIYSDSSIRMGSIRLERTNEINSSDNLLINYGSSTNVSLCQGGGNVGIGILTPTQKLDVRGNIITKGFGIQPYYLSKSVLPTISPGDGYKYKCLEIDGTTEISCIIADRAGLMNERGILIKFNKGYDGQIILLKDLQNYGSGNGYFWVMPSGCKIIKADGSSILIGQNQISNTYDDGHSRFLVYSSVYSVWIEFLCS